MVETKSQDAVALLKADHRAVAELFEQFEKARGDGRKQDLAMQICTELSVHAQIEEEIFYPACDGKVEDDLKAKIKKAKTINAVTDLMLHADTQKVLTELPEGIRDEIRDYAKARLVELGWPTKKAA